MKKRDLQNRTKEEHTRSALQVSLLTLFIRKTETKQNKRHAAISIVKLTNNAKISGYL